MPADRNQPGIAGPTAQSDSPPEIAGTIGVVETALSLRGAPYRNGGADPQGFDCSGFTQYVFSAHGMALPRAVRDQFQAGSLVNADEIASGDLVFFETGASKPTTGPGPTHVGIAIGGDQFVHAPSSNGIVRVERLTSTYWSARYVGARRLEELEIND
jgi:cell wall-associated NlpC family hydrolase